MPDLLSPPSVAPAPVRLVLDTNVVLDLLHFNDPAAAPILDAIETGEAECWVEESALDELQRVVTYPALKLDAAAGRALVERYRHLAHQAEPERRTQVRLPLCKDPDDQKFVELAARIDADLLVSRDKALLALTRSRQLRFRIVTPAAACQGYLRRNTQRAPSDTSGA